MTRRRIGLDELRDRFLFTGEPDPRAIQVILLVAVALNAVIFGALSIDGVRVGASAFAWSGMTLLVGATALAFVAPRIGSQAMAALVAVLDLSALALLRLDEAGGAIGALALVPVLWLAFAFGTRGAVAGSLALASLFAGPLILTEGLSGETLSLSLFFPLVVAWGALAVARGLEHTEDALAHAEDEHRAYRTAVREREESRRINDAIMEASDVALAIIAADGTVTSENHRHRELMALEEAKQGRVFAEDGRTLLGEDDLVMSRAAAGDQFDHLRVWIGAEDDPDRVALSCSSRPVRTIAGKFIGAAISATDITDWMNTEKQRQEFVASVSHELRTPLTTINGYVSIMLDEDDEREHLPPNERKQLQAVARNADRLHRLVNDILHSAQDDRGTMDLARERCDVTQILRWSVEAARSFAEPHDVRVEMTSPPFLQIDVDPQRFGQMIDNLLSNAVKFTEPGGTVSASMYVSGGLLELSIADTGVGIAELDRERLYSRFFRAPNTASHSIQGIGLGLSIVKQIVDGHGGSIDVDSEVGVGTTFRIRLPIGVRETTLTSA